MATYRQAARQEWDQARRKAFWAEVWAKLKGAPDQLLSFQALSQRVQLGNAFYRGARNVPLAKIVGSVGRYQDFTQAFLPTTPAMQERWQNIAALYLNSSSGGVPPIEVYKVGEVYFVRDGNHRVSVAKQLGFADIEAYVWEYPEQSVKLAPGVDIDTAFLEAERQTFLEQTQLDGLRPGHDIRLTVPGGYNHILGQIVYYQYALGQIDDVEIPYAEAVTAWYDMRYEVVTQIIETAGVIDLFPDRTPADFYMWLTQHHRELEERYGEEILLEAAAKNLEKEHGPNFPRRIRGRLRGWIRRITKR